MDLVIKNGTIVTDHDIYAADIGIENGKIVYIAEEIMGDYQTIDAQGKYIFPGFIDPHVHLNLPMRGTFSAENFETGTRAAAAGGVTTIIDFATQMGDQPLSGAIAERMNEADGKTFIDYGFHGGITNWDVVKDEFDEIVYDGITSFKMFMAYRERGLFSPDNDIIQALEAGKECGAMILVHAESGDIIDGLLEKYDTPEMKKKHGVWAHVLSRPNVTESEAIQRAITLAEYAEGHIYIVHMSTGEGVDLVKAGRLRGVNAVGETCPQYLLFNEEIFKKEKGHYFATAPQVKQKKDNERLWAGLAEGSLQVIGTDSCAFTSEQKDKWENDFTKIPLGMPGTELMASLLFSEGVMKRRITLNQFVQLVSANASRIYGLYPRKGAILVGSDADLVIFNPKRERIVNYEEMETDCDWNPYQGMKLTGAPEITILRGKIIAKNGKCVGVKGFGQYLRREASGNYVK